MRIVYIAGPLKGAHARDIADNINEAEKIGEFVVSCGAYPFIPHANTRNFFGTAPEAFFYQATLEMLRRCDAIAMCPRWQGSKGATAERSFALLTHIPLFDLSSRQHPQEWARLDQWIKSHE